MTDFSILLFDGFETLDAMGPAEIIGILPEHFQLRFCSKNGGIVTSAQGARVDTLPFSAVAPGGVILIPGGIGTRALIRDDAYISAIRSLALDSRHTLTVCTGAMVLAKTGLLDGREATTNKLLFDLVSSLSPAVRWRRKARWVVDGKYCTSSGITAGMDMALGFVRDTVGYDTAKTAAVRMEYLWNEDRETDPFA
jgi:transcriptional regulator GlxA family with amidase domain